MILKPIRQQFMLNSNVDSNLERLANELGKKPAQIKSEILAAVSNISADKYYIALGSVQQIAKNEDKKRR